MKITVTVNGVERTADIEDRQLLVYFVRDQLGLTGSKVGCDTSSCGACTVLLDGTTAKSCTVLAAQADGSTVTTIEGLEHGGTPHPVQRAFHERHALQCGYCTAGMIMASVGLIDELSVVDEASVRAGLKGNLCRCTGYQNIVDAVVAAGHDLFRPEAMA